MFLSSIDDRARDRIIDSSGVRFPNDAREIHVMCVTWDAQNPGHGRKQTNPWQSEAGCSIPSPVILPTRKSRDARLSQDSAGFVGALRYGGDQHDAGFGSTSDVHGRGTSWAWGVSGKMPRRRQGLQQPMYLAIPKQGTRVAR
jgi:hypothetical protein